MQTNPKQYAQYVKHQAQNQVHGSKQSINQDSKQSINQTSNINQTSAQRDERDSKIKIILVSGSPLKLERQINQPIYFDQFGELTLKFNITQVPATVEQDGKYLRIKQIYVGKNNLQN